jgi:Fe2+ transport system protein B
MPLYGCRIHLHHVLPAGPLTSLLVDGVIAGLSGVMVFIPQIAILFAFISILEDTGYMSRVTFMMDKLMRKVGLNGKSVVPLIGGFACAVPSIMAHVHRELERQDDHHYGYPVGDLFGSFANLYFT